MATKSTVLKVTIWNFSSQYPYYCSIQKYNFVWVGTPDFREGPVQK